MANATRAKFECFLNNVSEVYEFDWARKGGQERQAGRRSKPAVALALGGGAGRAMAYSRAVSIEFSRGTSGRIRRSATFFFARGGKAWA